MITNSQKKFILRLFRAIHSHEDITEEQAEELTLIVFRFLHRGKHIHPTDPLAEVQDVRVNEETH